MNKKGFSLIELMIVVSIMAILSLVAIPSYKSFKAKARQKEGFSLLNLYYTKAISTRLEFGHFPGNFVQTGFAPRGDLFYRLQAVDNANDISMRKNDDLCVDTSNLCNCATGPIACPEYKIWNELPVGALGRIGPAVVNPLGGGCPVLGTSDDQFVVGVAGWVSGSAPLADKYVIDELKNVTMCQDGLK